MNKHKKSLIVALIAGLLFPYGWIVVTGSSSIVDQSSVNSAYAAQLPPEQYQKYMQEHMHPMTLIENLYTSAITAVELWHIYLAWSSIIAAVIFVLNLFIWPKK